MINLEINNEQSKFAITDELSRLAEKVVNTILKHQKIEQNIEISLTFTNNIGIKNLNFEYRGIDRETDVLSFPLLDIVDGEISATSEDYDMQTGFLMLGDIIISLEKVNEQANNYEHTFERETAFLITHGMYHLLGFDHMDNESEIKMFKKQDEVLEILDIPR